MTALDYMAEILIYAAGAALSFRMLGPAALFSMPVFAAIGLGSIEYDRRMARRAALQSASDSSYLMLTIVRNTIEHSRKGMMTGIKAAVRIMDKYDAALAAKLAEIRQRAMLGEGAGEAFRRALEQDEGRYGQVEGLGQMLDRSDSMTAAKEAHISAGIESERCREESLGSLQRYASVNMAVGTIVPSFITFGFVGYSMMASNALAGYAFAVSFGAVLPFAAKVVKSRMGEMRAKI